MANTYKNDYAHPVSFKSLDQVNLGMTKREYFAALALQGLVAKGYSSYKMAAMDAVELADVLIAKLNEENK